MKISVYITSYNQKSYLIEAVESVLNQSRQPDEIVIVDDCSSDGSQDVITGYASRYPGLFTPVLHQQNQGISGTRNDAISAATGDFIANLDGDDYYFPHKLELELDALEQHPSASWVYASVDAVDSQGNFLHHMVSQENGVSGVILKDIVMHRVSPRSMLLSREALLANGLYDLKLSTHEDWDFKIRLSRYFKAVYVPEVLSVYRKHNAGLHKVTQICARLQNMIRVIDRTFPLLEGLPPEEAKAIQTYLVKSRAHRYLQYSVQSGNKRDGWRFLVSHVRQNPPSLEYLIYIPLLLMPKNIAWRTFGMWRAFKK